MKLTFKKFVESKTTEEDKIDLKTGQKIAKEIIKKLGLKYIDKVGPDTKAKLNAGYPVGSIRREKASLGDIDLLITKQLNAAAIASVVGVSGLSSKGDKQIFFDYTSDDGVDVSMNIWMLPKNMLGSFGAMMMHTTGSHQNNILLRMIAKRAGEKLNQYGVWDKDNNQIGGATELSVYKGLKTKKWPDGKEWKHPKERK